MGISNFVAQFSAIDKALKTARFIQNKCLRYLCGNRWTTMALAMIFGSRYQPTPSVTTIIRSLPNPARRELLSWLTSGLDDPITISNWTITTLFDPITNYSGLRFDGHDQNVVLDPFEVEDMIKRLNHNA